MVTTPGSSSVSAASKPLAVEYVWHTCCFPFIFYAPPLQGLTGPVPPPLPSSVLNQSAVPQVSYRPQHKDFLHFLSEFFNFSLELSILPSKRQAHSSLEFVSLQCFQYTLFCQEGLQWVPQSTYHLQPPALSLLGNTTSILLAEWETTEGIFFFLSRSDQMVHTALRTKKTLQFLFCSLFLIFEEIN